MAAQLEPDSVLGRKLQKTGFHASRLILNETQLSLCVSCLVVPYAYSILISRTVLSSMNQINAIETVPFEKFVFYVRLKCYFMI